MKRPPARPRRSFGVPHRLPRDEDGQTSTADQERECRQLGARLNLSDIVIFAEKPGTSGFKDVPRPVFDALLAALMAGDVVLAWSLDRLTRRGMEQAGTILRVLEERGARLVTVSDGVDTLATSSELNMGIRAIMAREYSKGLSANVKRGKKTGAVAGRPSGGPRKIAIQGTPVTKASTEGFELRLPQRLEESRKAIEETKGPEQAFHFVEGAITAKPKIRKYQSIADSLSASYKRWVLGELAQVVAQLRLKLLGEPPISDSLADAIIAT